MIHEKILKQKIPWYCQGKNTIPIFCIGAPAQTNSSIDYSCQGKNTIPIFCIGAPAQTNSSIVYSFIIYIIADQAYYVHVFYAAIENFFLICCWHLVLSLSNLKPQNVIQG
jgi:hypothetical protein